MDRIKTGYPIFQGNFKIWRQRNLNGRKLGKKNLTGNTKANSDADDKSQIDGFANDGL